MHAASDVTGGTLYRGGRTDIWEIRDQPGDNGRLLGHAALPTGPPLEHVSVFFRPLYLRRSAAPAVSNAFIPVQ